MGHHEYRRTEEHDDLHRNLGREQQARLRGQELIAMGLFHIGNSLLAVAAALEGSTAQPDWAIRMEQVMTDASEALARLSQNVDNLTSEVGEISNVLANLPTSEDPAIAAGINEAADRLSALRESLESATQLDDPAEQPPAEGETGDQPPASAPPEGEAGNTVA